MVYPQWRRKLWHALEAVVRAEGRSATTADVHRRMQLLAMQPAERPAAMRAALERAKPAQDGVPDEEAVERYQAVVLAVDLLRPYREVAL